MDLDWTEMMVLARGAQAVWGPQVNRKLSPSLMSFLPLVASGLRSCEGAAANALCKHVDFDHLQVSWWRCCQKPTAAHTQFFRNAC